jgi:hypothetical protein
MMIGIQDMVRPVVEEAGVALEVPAPATITLVDLVARTVVVGEAGVFPAPIQISAESAVAGF